MSSSFSGDWCEATRRVPGPAWSIPVKPRRSDCRWWVGVAVILSASLLPRTASPQALWAANGTPVCVLPNCGGTSPRVIGVGAGATIVSWQFYLSSASGEDLSAVRVSSAGQPDPGWPQAIGGPPITRAPGNQFQTDILPDGSGGAFVVWDDRRDALANGVDVYAQHVLADGQIAPGWPANGLAIATGPRDQDRGHLLPDGAGGVYVVWDDDQISGHRILLQRLNSDGSLAAGWPAGGIHLRDSPGAGARGAGNGGLVPDGAGGCLVLWADGGSGLGHEIYAQRVTSAGQVAGGWPANGKLIAGASSTNYYRGAFFVASDGAGGAYFAWGGTSTLEALDDDVYAAHVLADGSLPPGWPANGLPVCVQPDWQPLTSTVPDGAGGLLLAWYDHRTYPPRVYVQRLNPDGSLPAGWQANGNPISDVPGYQARPRLAPDGAGGAFVAFEEAFQNYGYVQRVRGNGTRPPGWPSAGLRLVDPAAGSSQRELAIAPDGSGGAVVVWNDTRNGIGSQLYAQRYTGADPTAVQMSLASLEALPDRVTIAWSRAGSEPTEASIERRDEGGPWRELARGAFDGGGRLAYEDRSVAAGARYAYRLRWSEGGEERLSAETRVDVPRAIELSLEGLRPNPAGGDLHVAFSLPAAGRTSVELVDLAGRRVRAHEASGLGAGRHVVRMDQGKRLEPGIYWVRLKHDERTLTVKGMVLR